MYCLRIESLNRWKTNHPNKRNNIGIHADIYCNKGMECREAVNKIKKTEITKREIDLLNFFKGPKNNNGNNSNGNR